MVTKIASISLISIYRPDVLVEIELQKENQEYGPVPILIIEVHSKSYESTLAKLVHSLINHDQLHFL